MAYLSCGNEEFSGVAKRKPLQRIIIRIVISQGWRAFLSTYNQINGLKGAAEEKSKALKPATEDPPLFINPLLYRQRF